MMSEDEIFDRTFLLLKLERLQQNFASGDTLALYECVRLCGKNEWPPPAWAMEELSRIAAVELRIEDPPQKVRGRHANPHERREDMEKWRLVLAALKACEYAGLKGEKKLEKAKEMLDKILYGERQVSLSTLEQARKHAPTNVNPRFIDFRYFKERLGIDDEIDLSEPDKQNEDV